MSEVAAFVRERLGHQPADINLWERALTHSSLGSDSYERLEFLGDRVLGLAVARWLYERFPNEPEGKLSRRYNALVARETCAEVGRELGVPALVRLGKQAREDNANSSDNVIGDVVEALVGALFMEAGFEAAAELVRSAWGPFVEGQSRAPQHPKSALQELAAARELRPPEYEVVGRVGAHHAPRFKVRVSIRGAGDAEAEGASKQQAETEAATKLLKALQ